MLKHEKNSNFLQATISEVYRIAVAFYPLNILGAQGVISVKGQAMTIKQAIQLIEKTVITHFSTMLQT